MTEHKKVWKKRAIKLAALGLVMFLIYMGLAFLLKRTSVPCEFHIRGFYREPEDTLDVALIGASELYADYSAPLAYRDYGFTSYNLCYESAPGCLYDSMLKEFLKTQDPQLVVFEVNGFFYNEERSHKEAGLRNWLDNVDHSEQWKSDIEEYVPEEERINYYFSFLKYHANWARPEGGIARLRKYAFMYKEDVSLMKSFGARTTSNSHVQPHRKKPVALTDYGRESLEELIACCKENGLENVLFIRTPHKQPLSEKTAKDLEEVITAAGYDFMNFDPLSDEMDITTERDYYNDDHLNVIGSRKFTSELGRYITEHYDLSTDHDSGTAARWEKCADYTENAFQVLEQRTLENEDILYNEFTDLSDKNHQRLLKIKAANDKKRAEKAAKKKADPA